MVRLGGWKSYILRLSQISTSVSLSAKGEADKRMRLAIQWFEIKGSVFGKRKHPSTEILSLRLPCIVMILNSASL